MSVHGPNGSAVFRSSLGNAAGQEPPVPREAKSRASELGPESVSVTIGLPPGAIGPDDLPEPESGIPVDPLRSAGVVTVAALRGALHTFCALGVGLLAKAGTYALSATGNRNSGIVANGAVICLSGLAMVRGVEVAVQGARGAGETPSTASRVSTACKVVGTSLALAASLVPAGLALRGGAEASMLGAQLLAINAGRAVQGLVSDVAAELGSGLLVPTRLVTADGKELKAGTQAYQQALWATAGDPRQGWATLGRIAVPALVPYALAVWSVSTHVMPQVADTMGVSSPPPFGQGPFLDQFLASLSVGVGIALIESIQTVAAYAVDAAAMASRGLTTDAAVPRAGAPDPHEFVSCLDTVHQFMANIADRASLRAFINALFLDLSVAASLLAGRDAGPALAAVSWALIDIQRTLLPLAQHRQALAETPQAGPLEPGDFLTESPRGPAVPPRSGNEEDQAVQIHVRPRGPDGPGRA